MSRSRVTIRDVAKHAGVSHQTVSRVINNSERVKSETRALVEAAIEELGYRPNAIARSMARGRTCTLACISPNLTDYTFASIIEGAEAEVRKQGYYLVSSSAPTEEEFSRLVEELFTSRRAEGLFVINPYADNRHNLLPPTAPSVFVGARPRRRDTVSSVALDDVSVARQATQHLIELGHRRVAMITGPMVEDCSQDRCSGYEAALEDNSITLNPKLVITGDWAATSGYLALQQLFDFPTPPTAIFAQNDRMAIGVLRAAREMGIAIPEELSVIGVDDMPLSSYFDPPLTTMRQDPLSIGRDAARLLIDTLEKRVTSPQHLLLQAQLIQRQSTGPIES
ncbi:MAG: LacI family DNA-binding transcriptional regulator [Anaerolineales bacterium]|nr:LacI family DNA-binding transcriptional regulator [Chloroflexota bacterium]MBL6983756.1 LacI family DNA-binding transcriptional regulator [Anaerolineales bacterium]